MPESQENKARELLDVDPEEVSLVDLGANKRKFLVIKQDPTRNQRPQTPVDKGTEEMENAENTEEPESTEEPEATEEPESTEEPEATEEPESTEEPVAKSGTLTQTQAGLFTAAVDALKSFGESFNVEPPAPEQVSKALEKNLQKQITKGFADLQKKQTEANEEIKKRLDKLEGARPSAESETAEEPVDKSNQGKSDAELFGGIFGPQ